MDIVVIGSGPAGLLTGAALAQRGHPVVSVDRDPGPAADGSWVRRGVMQFEHAHGFRPQVGDVLAKRWPAGLEAWLETGAEPVEITLPDGTTVPIGHRSLRSTFERALRAAALRTPGLELRVGHIDALLTTRIDEIAAPFYMMTALPACLEPAEPLARAAYDSGWRPPYAAGPGRDDLVEMLAAVAV
ncbi:MAG: FAD-dependent oxidoreductase [Nocardioides sp.]|uniref:FAD-dependent oxidoreductase n=1 Tax=Nocardioides sp. TaxID=35761 RepID=UPI0039E233DA